MIGKIATIPMAVSESLVVELTETLVVKNLSHPLNLSLQFLRDCRARLNYGRGTPHLQIQGEQIPILAQMETKEMEHQEREQLEPVTGEGENEMDEVAGKLEETVLEERTDLPGENQIPLNKISEFTELRQNYLNIVNSCSKKFKEGTILPSVDRPDWGHMASQQGVIGARIGNQQEPGPRIASLTSKNTKQRKKNKQARAKLLAPLFECPLSLSNDQGVLLPPGTVTPVVFNANISMDRHKASYFIEETIIGDTLQEVVVPEGTYPAQGHSVKILVANNGSEASFIPAGLDIHGFVVGETGGTAQPPSPAAPEPVPPPPAATIGEMSSEDFSILLQDLKIDENKLLKEHPQVYKKLKALLWQYRDIFSNTTPGCTDQVELDLELVPGTQPIRQRFRDLNPDLEKKLQDQINTWLEEGVIEPSKSPWSSPLVPVKKKDGSVRWAVDYRLLNKHLVMDSYPLPKIQQLVEKAGGHRVYSALDAVAAYYTIPVAMESRPVTAFTSPHGLYQWTRMPFGLATAPSVYSRFIQAILNPLGTDGLQAYLDDILLYHNSLDDHLDRLAQVFQAHREGGIRLKPSKTQLFREQIDYLGHTLSQDGVAMQAAYIDRIMEWPVPATPKELNTLLGFLGYYRAFIPEFSTLTAEMNSQKTAKILEWTDEMTAKLAVLKTKFSAAPIRAPPRFDLDEPFQLTTDFSSKAISAILSQVQDGQERLIAAAGRKTTTAERNYPSYKGELAAVIFGCRKFHSILSYKKFRLNTDSSALLQIKQLKPMTSMLIRWTEELASLDFEVKHRPGKLNTNADALSRREDDCMPAPTAQEEQEQAEYLNLMAEALPAGFREGADGAPEGPGGPVAPPEIELGAWAIAQAEDEVLQVVDTWITRGEKPSRAEIRGKALVYHKYAHVYNALSKGEDQVLRYYIKTFLDETRERYLVPDSKKEEVFQMVHCAPGAGHFGINATTALALRHFWYPGIQADIRARVKTCIVCVQKDLDSRITRANHVPGTSGFPGQTLYIDLVVMPASDSGHRYVLSMQDGFSRFISLAPLRTKTTGEVIQALMEKYISRFGCPLIIHSDNGKEFVNDLMKALLVRLEVAHTTTPAYNPQSNNVERFHRTLKTYYRCWMARHSKSWVEHLPYLELAYNSKVNETTGLTPFLVFLGREAKLPADMILPNKHEEFPTEAWAVRKVLKNMDAIYTYLKDKEDCRIRRNAMRYSNEPALQDGDIVWYLSARNVPDKPLKVTKQWTGPWQIVRRVAQVLYEIKPFDGSCGYPAIVVHVGRIRPFNLPLTQRFMPDELVDRADEDAATLPLTDGDRIPVPDQPDAPEPNPPAQLDRPSERDLALRRRRYIEPPNGQPTLPGDRRNRPARQRRRRRSSLIRGPDLNGSRGDGDFEDNDQDTDELPEHGGPPGPADWSSEDEVQFNYPAQEPEAVDYPVDPVDIRLPTSDEDENAWQDEVPDDGELDPADEEGHDHEEAVEVRPQPSPALRHRLRKRPRDETTADEPPAEARPPSPSGMQTRNKTKLRRLVAVDLASRQEKEFESVCRRKPDGTVDLEPANLARMCTLTAANATLPYRQNKKAARYHVYAKEAIHLPASTAVVVDLGYRVNLKANLMVHTFAPAGLRGRHIEAAGILTTGKKGSSSKVQLVNLAPYDQKISRGATLCSAMVTRGDH
ncbi:MAG: DDE-type integrase/transposase/recombinase [Gammaproteobacteria bacterium]|nr:DDE-type integrase/transposase/recombinase [Gammaproteobacteria bacterium]